MMSTYMSRGGGVWLDTLSEDKGTKFQHILIMGKRIEDCGFHIFTFSKEYWQLAITRQN